MGKHKRVIIICSVILIIVILSIAVYIIGNNSGFTQKPFNDLLSEDISSITVHAIPPDETVLIDNMEQVKEIVEILKTIVIYEKDDGWKNSAGQMVTFSIYKTNGEVVEVRAYNPHIIIDNQGYKTEYQLCENLNRIANTLLGTRFGGQPIE